METAERLLALLGLLQARADWSADSLAERLEVTTRTVRRDISRLRAYGYPVEATAGHGGGYRLGPGGSLPPLLLDDHETLAVAIGLRIASQAAIAGLEGASVSALAKIEQLLPVRLRPRLEQLDSVVVIEGPRAVLDRKVFSSLVRAATLRTTARFEYPDQRHAVTSRHVEPVQLVRSRHTWYLVAYDLDRSDWRVFRVDRITEVEITERRFAERSGPDPVRLVRRGVPAEHFAFRAVIDVEASAVEARKRIPATIAKVTELNEHRSRLLIGTDDLEWLARYLMSLPWRFEAIEPAALRHELRKLGRTVAQQHATRQ